MDDAGGTGDRRASDRRIALAVPLRQAVEQRHLHRVGQSELARGVPGHLTGRHRGDAGVVIGQDCRELIRRRRAHAVELRKGAVAVPEEAQHRHHTVDGVQERRRRRDAARLEGLPQRQEIDEQIDQHARIAADVSAVGQNLAIEFLRELTRARLQEPRLALDAQAGKGERDDDQQEGQQAVAELDDAVDAHLGGVGPGLVGAPGPGRAPQPAAGEADRSPGDDEQRVGHQRGPGQHAHPPGDVRGQEEGDEGGSGG